MAGESAMKSAATEGAFDPVCCVEIYVRAMLPDSLTERVPAWDNVRGTGAASRRCPQYKVQQGSCKLALDGSVGMLFPTSLEEAVEFFGGSPEYCQRLWRDARWPDGVIRCPHCGAPASLPKAGQRPHCKTC